VIVGGNEDHVGDLIVGDELEQVIALRAVASDVGLAAVGVDRAVGASRAKAGKVVQREGTADRPDLVDRIGDGDELPPRSGLLRVEQVFFSQASCVAPR
jgi:predicted NUDIX family NTP pyrophosphohydrolase